MPRINVQVRGVYAHGVPLDVIRGALRVTRANGVVEEEVDPDVFVMPTEVAQFLDSEDIPDYLKQAFTGEPAIDAIRGAGFIAEEARDGERRESRPLNGALIIKLYQKLDRVHDSNIVLKGDVIANTIASMSDKALTQREAEYQLGAYPIAMFPEYLRLQGGVRDSLKLSLRSVDFDPNVVAFWRAVVFGEPMANPLPGDNSFEKYFLGEENEEHRNALRTSLGLSGSLIGVSSEEVELGVDSRYVQENTVIVSSSRYQNVLSSYGQGLHLIMKRASVCARPLRRMCVQENIVTPFNLTDIRNHFAMSHHLLEGNDQGVRGNSYTNSDGGYVSIKGHVFISKSVTLSDLPSAYDSQDGLITGSGTLTAWGYITPTDFQPIMGNIHGGISSSVIDTINRYSTGTLRGYTRARTISVVGRANTNAANDFHAPAAQRSICTGNANTIRAREVLESEIEQWNADLGTSLRHITYDSYGGAYGLVCAPLINELGDNEQGNSTLSNLLALAFGYDDIPNDGYDVIPSNYNFEAIRSRTEGWYKRYVSPLDYNDITAYAAEGTHARISNVVIEYELFPIARLRELLTGEVRTKTKITMQDDGANKVTLHDMDSWWVTRSTGPSHHLRQSNYQGRTDENTLDASLSVPEHYSLIDVAEHMERNLSYSSNGWRQLKKRDTPAYILFDRIVKKHADELFVTDEEKALSHTKKVTLVVFSYITFLRYVMTDMYARTIRECIAFSPESKENIIEAVSSMSSYIRPIDFLFAAMLPTATATVLRDTGLYFEDPYNASLFRGIPDTLAGKTVHELNAALEDDDALPYITLAGKTVHELNAALEDDALPYIDNGVDEVLSVFNPVIFDQVVAKIESDGSDRLLALLMSALVHVTPISMEKAVAESAAQMFI